MITGADLGLQSIHIFLTPVNASGTITTVLDTIDNNIVEINRRVATVFLSSEDSGVTITVPEDQFVIIDDDSKSCS